AETSFMTSMIAYQNDWTIFFTRPISGVVMALTLLALAFPALRALRHRWRVRRAALSAASGVTAVAGTPTARR
ncbi:MAG: hypothetical protein ACREX6_08280, partial [Casimicrobiaceae bacterium]